MKTTDTKDVPSDVMKLPEAAAFLQCHPETLKKMAIRDGIPHRRLGSAWRFSRVALTKWIQGQGD